MSTNITTTYGSRKNGSGVIVAKGGGKQCTTGYDQTKTPMQNHGIAAFNLIAKSVRPDRRHILAVGARHIDLGNGKHRFTVSI